jgi:hypothetical protein
MDIINGGSITKLGILLLVTILFTNLALMDVDYKFIGMLKKMSIGKYLQNKTLYTKIAGLLIIIKIRNEMSKYLPIIIEDVKEQQVK